MKFNEMMITVSDIVRKLDDEIKAKIPEAMLDHEYVPYVTFECCPTMDAILVKYCNSIFWSSANDTFEEYETDGEFEDMLRSELCLCAKFMALGVDHLTATIIFQGNHND
jgi:hypothetical protein